MSAATDPASALTACARLRAERDRARDIAVALEAKVARVEALMPTGTIGARSTIFLSDLRASLNPEDQP